VADGVADAVVKLLAPKTFEMKRIARGHTAP
jgi:hypothetical protein